MRVFSNTYTAAISFLFSKLMVVLDISIHVNYLKSYTYFFERIHHLYFSKSRYFVYADYKFKNIYVVPIVRTQDIF